MSNAGNVNITSPAGRLVQGSLYEAQTKDFDGNPLVVKTGPQAGQARVSYYFALAIPKGTERHWAETDWGKKIWAIGHAAFPIAAANHNPGAFAWKIDDGDSQIPNKKGRKPADQEGFKGCWILKLSSSFAPKAYRLEGDAPKEIMEPGAIKIGYFVQVNFDATGNDNAKNPGIYLNHRMVCLIGYGPEIQFGPDPTSAGFGAALPPGASAVPVGGFAPAAPVGPVAPAPAPLPAPVAAPPAPVAVQPYPAPMAPAAAPPPPGAPVRRMTAKAQFTYEGYIGSGWTDAQLVQHGIMEP